MKKIEIFILVLLCGFISSCSSTKPKQKIKSTEYSIQDETLEIARSTSTQDARQYEAIDREFRAKKYNEVLDKTRAFIKKYPQSQFLEQIYHLRSLSSIALKQFPNAVAQLKKTLEIANARQSPNEQLIAMVTYNLAFVYFELNQIDEATSASDKVNDTALDSNNRARLFILKAKLYRISLEYVESMKSTLVASENAVTNSTLLKSLGTFLDELLEHVDQVSILETLTQQYSRAPIIDRIYHRLAMTELKNGNRQKADDYFENIVKNYPESPYFGIASENIRTIQKSSELSPKKIGVVLTLSGKFSSFGYRALQGIQLALNMFTVKSDPTAISMVVIDDEGNPEKAIRAIEELYYVHHVIGVIGPISSKTVNPMAKKANELGLPLITLTQFEPEPLGGYVFSAGLTASTQVKTVLKYATEKLKMKNFAMLAPQSAFGAEYTKYFWDEVEKNGGSMKGYETYATDEKDFRIYIDKLVGLNSNDARKKERDELSTIKQKIIEQMKLKKLNKRLEQTFSLKPIVDFDAVFIPEDPQTLGQLLPTFAFRDVEKIQFLGMNLWNRQELVSRAASFAEGSVFVDGFFAHSSKPAVQEYAERYRAQFGMEPNMVDASSFDAAKLIQSIIQDRNISRDDLKVALERVNNFPGLSGPIQYSQGNLAKSVHLLTLRNGKIEEIAF